MFNYFFLPLIRLCYVSAYHIYEQVHINTKKRIYLTFQEITPKNTAKKSGRYNYNFLLSK